MGDKVLLYSDSDGISIHTQQIESGKKLITVEGVNLTHGSKFNVIDADINKRISINIRALTVSKKYYTNADVINQTVKILYDADRIFATISNTIYPYRGPVVKAQIEKI